MEEEKIYYAALYLRLSKEDEYVSESNSIHNQKEMLLSYVEKKKDMVVYDIYSDDGFTGVHFERPEFQRMMKDIQENKVNCVIVKDLSRLGRDYIEAGRLIQKTFPAFFVRFIALVDGYDSLTAKYQETAMMVPIKNFINDSYCRDISCKVRSHQKIKREKGEFIGAFAVYGYKKSTHNKNLLVPDEYASIIVQKIFAWKMEGYSLQKIANQLEECGILSPMEYKRLHGERLESGFIMGDVTKWSAVAVNRILSNEMYIGTMVQGKEETINYKVKKSVKKPKEEWIKVKDTHCPIVRKEDFFLVQELSRTNIRACKGEKRAHMYAGLVFCEKCRKPMTQRKVKYQGKEKVLFICSSNNKGKGCLRHCILEEQLNQCVLECMQKQIECFCHKEKVYQKVKMLPKKETNAVIFTKEKRLLLKQKNIYEMLINSLDEDVEKKIISKEEYMDFGKIYRKRLERISKQILRQDRTLQRLLTEEKEKETFLKKFYQNIEIKKLDRLLLLTFIKRILVCDKHTVFIEFRYKNAENEGKQNGKE